MGARSLHPYAVLEEWEKRVFREHFRGQEAVGLLDVAPVAVLDSNVGVRVYDLLPGSPGAAPDVKRIRHIPRSRCSEPEDP